MRTLHITNGDGAGEIIKASSIDGDVLPWRDPMHHGPFPSGLSLDEARPVRAKYLAGPDGDVRAVERNIELRDAHLSGASEYDRVLLWFEHDLLDQLQIIQILDWFATAKLGNTVLEMICIDRFEGIDPFRGIGQLNPTQMASLFTIREAISDETLELAQAGWSAFGSANPEKLFEFIQNKSENLPFLNRALERHLEEFPNIYNGLNRTENQLLSLVEDGVGNPVELFIQNMDMESVLFMGDWRTFSVIGHLARAELLACEDGIFWHPPHSEEQRKAFREQRLVLTAQGNKVRKGEIDGTGLMNRDEWLGGVHLQSGKALWRWDAENRKPVLM